MKINMEKLPGSRLVAFDDIAEDELNKFKTHEVYEVEIKRGRNPQFHRKVFAFLGFVYHHFNDPNEHLGKAKSFDLFRKNLTILAGYYDETYSYDGSVKLEAKSLSYASMSQSDFEELYSALISAAIKTVFNGSTDQNLYNQLLSYF